MKKSILIINGYLDIGGAERVLTYLANTLCSDYLVTFAILQTSKNDLFCLDERITLIQMNLEDNRKSSHEMGVMGTIDYFKKTCAEIRKLADKIKPDIVIAFNDREVLLTWLALHNYDVKLVYSQRNDPQRLFWRTNLALRYAYNHCDGVVFQLKKVQEFYNLHKKTNIAIIENPAHIEELRPVFQRSKKIIAAGRLVAQKRFDLLIEAFSIFHENHEDYYLEIYGKGKNKESLQDLIFKHKLNDYIKIYDPIPNVMKQNRDADMFVLSSDYEGIPNILIEAMVVGIPCISTDCEPGGGALLTNNGDCGLLVECNNVQQLVAAMDRYASDDQLKSENVQEAYKYIQQFSEENIGLKWKSFIEKVLGK